MCSCVSCCTMTTNCGEMVALNFEMFLFICVSALICICAMSIVHFPHKYLSQISKLSIFIRSFFSRSILNQIKFKFKSHYFSESKRAVYVYEYILKCLRFSLLGLTCLWTMHTEQVYRHTFWIGFITGWHSFINCMLLNVSNICCILYTTNSLYYINVLQSKI